MQTGLPALGQALFLVAGLIGLVGVVALSKPGGVLWRSLSRADSWQFVAGTTVIGVLENALSACGGWVHRFAGYWFTGSPQNHLSGSFFLVIALAALPLAAGFNHLRGGSPFLISVIFASLVGLALITVLGEAKKFRALLPVLAIAVFLSLFVFVPGYTWVSFTHRLIGRSMSQAALGSVLVLPLIYLACHTTAVAIAGIAGGREGELLRPIIYAIASLPVAFVLTISAMLFGHLLVPNEPSILEWRNLLLGMGVSALVWAVSFALVEARPWAGLATAFALGLGGSLGLALWALLPGYPGVTEALMAAINVLSGMTPGGELVRVGPLFWFSHLPFLPAILLVLALAGALIAKLVAGGLSPGNAEAHGYAATATGLTLIAVALVVAALGMFLQNLA